MSTTFLGAPMTMLGMPSARCSTQTAVSTEQEQLSDYVRRVANEKGLSYREVARRGGISSPSISDIVSKKTINIKASTIRALAKGLGVPEEEVFAAYSGRKPITEEDLADDQEIAALFYEYKELTDEDKKELRTIWLMVRQEIRRRREAGELASQKNSKKARVR